MDPVAFALREANNADWTSAIVLPAAGPVPWAAVPAWSSAAVYTAGAAVTVGADLYVAPSTPTVGRFLAGEWVQVGSAAVFAGQAFDFSGATFRMWLSLQDPTTGLAAPATPAVQLATAGGTLVADANARTVRLALPALKARGLVAGAYSADLLAFKGTTPLITLRVAAGTVTVDPGYTR